MPTKSLFHAFLTLLCTLALATACQHEKVEKINAVEHRDSIAGLEATNITTVISDSGITRYRIYAEKWDVYDEAKPPYWEFTKGVLFEQFDEQLNIDATFQADYAKYLEESKLWEFKGKVRAINLKGEMFETELMYWNQQTEKIYSDRFVKVTLPTEVITGKGFVADQTMKQWYMTTSQAVFEVDEERME